MLFSEKKTRNVTEKQFDEKVDQLIEWVEASVSPFVNDTAEKQAERLRRAREDQDYFNETYLPHYFSQPSPDFHREMEELIDEGELQERPVAVGAPRGHAKSTRISLARVLKKALFKQKRFVLEISDTEIQAKGFTVSVRVETEHNARIVHDFGSQRTGQWAAGDFVTKTGCRVMARGDGQGIRGLKHGPYRPDLAVIDDIDNDESVRNPQRVKQTYDWIMQAVFPSLDPAHGVMFIVGTILSKKSVLARCIENEAFISKIYRSIEDPEWSEERKEFVSGIPLWPDRFSLERLSRIRRLIGSISFNKEYQNDPRDDEAKVREEWIKRIRFDAIDAQRPAYFQALDPSLGESEASDFQAHSTVAVDEKGKLYLRYADIKRRSIDSMVKNAYLLQARFMALALGLETIGFQKLLRRDFDREGLVQKRYLPIVSIDHHGVAKLPRILRLTPLMENGVLLFAEGPESEVGDVETWIEQMLFIEQGSVHDDGPDSGEMAVTIAEQRMLHAPSYEQVAQREARFEAGAY